jgi:hypothetical protein
LLRDRVLTPVVVSVTMPGFGIPKCVQTFRHFHERLTPISFLWPTEKMTTVTWRMTLGENPSPDSFVRREDDRL